MQSVQNLEEQRPDEGGSATQIHMSVSQEHVYMNQSQDVSMCSLEMSNDQSAEEPHSDSVDQAKQVSKALNDESLQSDHAFTETVFRKKTKKFSNKDARKP